MTSGGETATDVVNEHVADDLVEAIDAAIEERDSWELAAILRYAIDGTTPSAFQIQETLDEYEGAT